MFFAGKKGAFVTLQSLKLLIFILPNLIPEYTNRHLLLPFKVPSRCVCAGGFMFPCCTCVWDRSTQRSSNIQLEHFWPEGLFKMFYTKHSSLFLLKQRASGCLSLTGGPVQNTCDLFKLLLIPQWPQCPWRPTFDLTDVNEANEEVSVFTLYLIMVLKWLFLKKTQSSPSCTVDVSSHKPWYVSCVAVLFRNCSATMPGMREGEEETSWKQRIRDWICYLLEMDPHWVSLSFHLYVFLLVPAFCRIYRLRFKNWSEIVWRFSHF